MKFILGKKIGMTSAPDDEGRIIPITVVEAEPNVVVGIRTKEKDGYSAIQVGNGTKKKISKALKGHFGDLGSFRYVKEFRTIDIDGKEAKVGDKIDVSIFAPGDTVKVSGISKGKGFAGGMKRHGFSGMPASHGHKAVRRHIGSTGQRFPQHTLKGKRMPGRMGNEHTSARGLKIVTVDKEQNLLGIKGAVPGNKGGLIEITTM